MSFARTPSRIGNKKINDSKEQTINLDENIIFDPTILREYLLRDIDSHYFIGHCEISFDSFGKKDAEENWFNPLTTPILEFIEDILTVPSEENKKIQKIDLYLNLSYMRINDKAMSRLCDALKKSLCKNIILDFKHAIIDDKAYITLAKYIETGDYSNINLDLRLETSIIHFSTEVRNFLPIINHFKSAFSQQKGPPIHFTTSSTFVLTIFKNFKILLRCSYLKTLKISNFRQIEKLQINDVSFLEYLGSNPSLTNIAVHKDFFSHAWYADLYGEHELNFFNKVKKIIARNKMLQAEQNAFDASVFILLQQVDLPKELLKLIIQYVGEISTAPNVIHTMLDGAVEALEPYITPSGLTKACLILSFYLNAIDAPQIALHEGLLILIRDHIRLFCSYIQTYYDLEGSPKKNECEYALVTMIKIANPKHDVIKEIVLDLKESPSLKIENIKSIREYFEIKKSELFKPDQYSHELSIEIENSCKYEHDCDLKTALPEQNGSLKKELHLNAFISHSNILQIILFDKNIKVIKFHSKNISHSILEDITLALIASDIIEFFIPIYPEFRREIEITLDYNKREMSELDRALYKQKRAIQAFKNEAILQSSRSVLDTRTGFVIFSFIIARNPEYLETIFNDSDFRDTFIKNAISYFKQMINTSFSLYQTTNNIYFSGFRSDARANGWEHHVLSQIKDIFVAAKITIKERDCLFNALCKVLSENLYSILTAEDKSSNVDKHVTQFILALPVIAEESFIATHSTKNPAHSDEKKQGDLSFFQKGPGCSVENFPDDFKGKARKIDAILGQHEIAAELKTCIADKEKYQEILVKHLNNSNSFSLFRKTLSTPQIFQLQMIVPSHQTIPVSQLNTAIEIYQSNKGKGRKYIPFVKNKTITVSHFEELLRFTGNRHIDTSLIELCLKARDRRHSVGREGVIQNSFQFYKSGELPQDIQNKLNKTEKDAKTNLSQTELLINRLRPRL